jgi:Ca2+-binding EF-hand superfamily protein
MSSDYEFDFDDAEELEATTLSSTSRVSTVKETRSDRVTRELNRMFDELDTDGSGELGAAEIFTFVKKGDNLPSVLKGRSPREVRQLLDQVCVCVKCVYVS